MLQSHYNMEKAEKIEEVLTRSISKIYPTKEAVVEALNSGKQLSIYMGIDPTATYVHLGHSTNYIILKRFHELGHKVVVLIGDFTAMIGDPSDKTALRKKLTKEDVLENLKTFKEQIGKILNFNDMKNPIEFRFNSEWLSKLSFQQVVELASNFTVQQMIERDTFQKRTRWEVKCEICGNINKSPINFGSLETFNSTTLTGNKFMCQFCKNMAPLDKDHIFPSPDFAQVYLHEFLYPLMQGYDSVALDADIEIGGTDQTFNMLAGRTLVKAYQGREKFVISTTLLENPITGEKLMSKSLGTGVGLDEEPFSMYEKIMRIPDEAVIQCFIDCTYLSLEEIKKIEKELKNGENPRDIKMRLAYEIVIMYHNEDEAKKAQEGFVQLFQKNEASDVIPEVNGNGRTLEIVLIDEKIVVSKSELRRLADAGAITNFDTKTPLSFEEIKSITSGTYKIGKNRFIKIV